MVTVSNDDGQSTSMDIPVSESEKKEDLKVDDWVAGVYEENWYLGKNS